MSTLVNTTLLFFQTNISNNNNKYFLCQLLKENDKDIYYVWFRWGRVGYDGQNSLNSCGGNLDNAKKTFEKKYYIIVLAHVKNGLEPILRMTYWLSPPSLGILIVHQIEVDMNILRFTYFLMIY